MSILSLISLVKEEFNFYITSFPVQEGVTLNLTLLKERHVQNYQNAQSFNAFNIYIAGLNLFL